PWIHNFIQLTPKFRITAKNLLDFVGQLSASVRKFHAFWRKMPGSELPANPQERYDQEFNLMAIAHSRNANVFKLAIAMPSIRSLVLQPHSIEISRNQRQNSGSSLTEVRRP